FFSFTLTATTEIYTLSLHDALPILVLYGLGADAEVASDLLAGEAPSHERQDLLLPAGEPRDGPSLGEHLGCEGRGQRGHRHLRRSEEHTSELQSRGHLVCRLLLEKK